MREMIDTWDRLGCAIRVRWPVSNETGDSIAIGAGIRSLRIDRLEVAAFPDSAFVAIRFVLCRRDQLLETTALRINCDLALGTLVLRGGVYELQHVLDLTAVSARDLERRLGFLAKLVDALREVHAPRAAIKGDAYAYSMFAE